MPVEAGHLWSNRMIKIRPAQLDDALPMGKVIVDTFLASNRGLMSEAAWQRRKENWTYEVSAGNWRDLMLEIAAGRAPATCLYVAEDEAGKVVGMALGCPSKDEQDRADVGEIDVLYVSEAYQRRGIGSLLTQATAAHLARAGMTRLHICTPANNVQGRRFYEKLGGRVEGMREDDEDGEVVTLVVYAWSDIHTLVNLTVTR